LMDIEARFLICEACSLRLHSQDMQFTNAVTLRRVRASVAAVEKK